VKVILFESEVASYTSLHKVYFLIEYGVASGRTDRALRQVRGALPHPPQP